MRKKIIMNKVMAVALASAIALTGSNTSALISSFVNKNAIREAYQGDYQECDAFAMAGKYKDVSDQYYDEISKSTYYDFGKKRTYGAAMFASYPGGEPDLKNYINKEGSIDEDGYMAAMQEFSDYSIGLYDQMIDFEAYTGMRVECKNKSIAVTPYNHMNQDWYDIKVTVHSIKDKERDIVEYRLDDGDDIAFDKPITISTKDLEDGFYKIASVVYIQNPDHICHAYGYIRVQNGKAQTCRLYKGDEVTLRKQTNLWHYWFDGLNPKDYTSNKGVTYPTSGSQGACVHVEQWSAVADEIVGEHDDWTDEMKVFAFAEYLARNIAYDNWRASQPNNESRAKIDGGYHNDDYFTINNHVGVCWDYTNILSIMCRHYNIPCTSVEPNAEHTFNAVYMNDEWVCIDITQFVRYVCNEKNTNKMLWKKSTPPDYNAYGTYPDGIISVNEQIWTREKGLGLR